ncbi:MAG: nucleotidyltransferase family protein [Phycisphaerae bacterium]
MTTAQPESRIYAIVPAAGRSRRMGQAKQLLAVDAKPMLTGILESLADSQVKGIALVTYSEIGEAIDVHALHNTFIVVNDDQDTEMIDSIRLGLCAWHERESIDDSDGFLICPADQPGITTTDFNNCIDACRRNPDRIIIAAHQGRRGHPIIFPAAFERFVHSRACNTGLRALPGAHPDAVLSVACASFAVVRNINTPEDYDKLNER